MFRWLLRIVSAFSALLCVAGGVMWSRSYRHVEGVSYRSKSPVPYICVMSCCGTFSLETTREVDPNGKLLARSGYGFWTYSCAWDGPWPLEDWYDNGDFVFRRWGFVLASRPETDALSSMTTVAVPCWLAMIITAVPPFVMLRRFHRRRRWQRLGLCLICGYDLRASKDICPECGAVIPATTERRSLETS